MSDSTAAAPAGDNGGAASGAALLNAPAPAAAAQPPQGQKPWFADFDETTSAYVQNKGWQSPTDLLTSYRNLEKFAGGSKNLVELPGPDADPAKMEEFYNRLGRPTEPGLYGIEVPENGDPEMTNWFKQTAFELGLNARQAQELFNRYNGFAGEKMQSMEQQASQNAERDIASLKQEWGQGFDAQIDLGRRAAAALGFDADRLSKYESALGTGEMLKMFATLGSKMGEPQFADGGRSGSAGNFGVTPAQAQQQLADLKMDKDFMSQYMSGNKDAINKMSRLMEAAYAGS
jgi:hypothetical protein